MKTKFLVLTLFLVFAVLVSSVGVMAANETNGTTNATCTDTDGRDYTIRGTATLGESHEESCYSDNYVDEYYCINQSIRNDEYFLVDINGVDREIRYKGCDRSTDMEPHCKFEVMDLGETKTVTMSKVIAMEETLATLKIDSATLRFTNVTTANNKDADIRLLNRNSLRRERHTCESDRICENGACVPELNATCTDSDGGLVYNVQGTVIPRAGDETFTDICNGSILTEGTCDEQGGKVYDYNCESEGNICRKGRCTCPGDADGDGTVNAFDISLLRQQNLGADFNGDGSVNAFDLAIIRRNFGCRDGVLSQSLFGRLGAWLKNLFS